MRRIEKPEKLVPMGKVQNPMGKEHPDYFLADGLTIFVGAQGER